MMSERQFKKRILIVDAHASIRGVLASWINHDLGHEVVGQAGAKAEALQGLGKFRPDLLVLDLLGIDGLEVLREMRRTDCPTRVLIYTASQEKSLMMDVLEADPEGVVSKADELQTLRDAVRTVLDGGYYFSSFIKPYRRLARNGGGQDGSQQQLSSRERDVLRLVAEGHTNKQIAQKLFISVKTAEHHRESIRSKLSVNDTAGMLRQAIKLGLVTL